MEPEKHYYPHDKTERMKELDDMIAMGWGSVRQSLIPANWREVPGPFAELKGEEDDVPEPIEVKRESGTVNQIEHCRKVSHAVK